MSTAILISSRPKIEAVYYATHQSHHPVIMPVRQQILFTRAIGERYGIAVIEDATPSVRAKSGDIKVLLFSALDHRAITRAEGGPSLMKILFASCDAEISRSGVSIFATDILGPCTAG